MNMGYCKFENTVRDLRQCYEGMRNGELTDGEGSEYEEMAKKQIIKLCKRITEEFGETFNEEV